MELVSRPHVDNFIAWAAERPEVLVVTADLTNSCEVGRWRDTYPDRYVTAGMAEQNMLGVAAGLAREGLRPFVHTFAVFLYRRPYDQLAMSIAYPNLPVRLVGFLPGISTPGGVTHQAIEDLAIMRATPNMTVLTTADATEVESVLDVTEQVDGPVYIRMLRGQVPRLFPVEEPMQLGRTRHLAIGSHATVVTTGITTQLALPAVDVLRRRDITVDHLHVSTLKPFGDEVLREAFQRASGPVITMENHVVTGGLGSAVAEYMAERAIGRRLIRLGLKDTYAHGANQAHLAREYGLDGRALVGAVEDALGLSLDIDDAELDLMRQPGAANVNAEQL